MSKSIPSLCDQIDSHELTIEQAVRSLSPRDAKWIEAYIGEANFCASEAQRIAGPASIKKHASEKALKVGGWWTWKRLEPLILKLIDNTGISETRIKAKLMEKLDAEETKFFTHNGKVKETRKVVDHGTQLKALELLMRSKGMLDAKIADESERYRLFRELLQEVAAARANAGAQGSSAPAQSGQ